MTWSNWQSVLAAQAGVLLISLFLGGMAAWHLRPAPPEPKSVMQAVRPMFVPSHLASALKTAPYFRRLPENWKSSMDTELRKREFVEIVQPLVLLANARIGADRATIQVLFAKDRHNSREVWLLAAFYHHYKAQPGDRKELLKRLDEIPVALVIAQAAVETGWGRSRFAIQGNALFGEWTWNAKQMMVPKQRRAGLGNYGIRRFDSLYASVASYMKNLNTNRAYSLFRALRAHARAEARRPTGTELAAGLSRYSENGAEYIAMLRGVIRKENLEKLIVNNNS